MTTSIWKYSNKEYKVNKPLFISVPITGICNAACPFCINKFNKIPNLERDKLLKSLDKILSLTKEFLPTVSITGGEPTLYPDTLMDIIKIANNHSARTFLITNGSGLLKKMRNDTRLLEEALKSNLNLINISCVHYDMKINNEIMKTKALMSDAELREVFLICNKSNTKIRMSTTLLKSGIGTLSEAAKYCDWAVGLGCKQVVFRDLQCPQSINFVEPYIEENTVPMDKIWDELNHKDSPFEVIESDTKYFESRVCNYKGAQIRFQKFLNEDHCDNFIKELVLYPDGTLLNGWDTQMKLDFKI